jgi:hypothetical protein
MPLALMTSPLLGVDPKHVLGIFYDKDVVRAVLIVPRQLNVVFQS